MRVVSRSTYISQFPDVMAQKALLGSMRREEGVKKEAASRRKCRSKRRWLRGRCRKEDSLLRPSRGRRRTMGGQRAGGRKGVCREGAVDVRQADDKRA